MILFLPLSTLHAVNVAAIAGGVVGGVLAGGLCICVVVCICVSACCYYQKKAKRCTATTSAGGTNKQPPAVAIVVEKTDEDDKPPEYKPDSYPMQPASNPQAGGADPPEYPTQFSPDLPPSYSVSFHFTKLQ